MPGLPQVRRSYDGLRKARLDAFMDGFNAISLKLKEMYQMITLGGDAELELVDSLDPFSEARVCVCAECVCVKGTGAGVVGEGMRSWSWSTAWTPSARCVCVCAECV